jgi:hypothetical protein
MAPVSMDIDDHDLLDAKRDLSIRGAGLVLLVNGLLLALFWSLCYKALGGSLSADPGAVRGLAQNGYALVAFACVGYLIVMDMETVFQDGKEAARRVTLDWVWWCLLPLAAYIASAAVALDLPFSDPRNVAAAEGLIAGILVVYGLTITHHHTPHAARRS